MISDAFLSILTWVVETIFQRVPAGPDLPDGLLTTANEVFGLASGLNAILPVEEVFVAIGIYFAFEIAMIVLAGLLWIIRLIRGN